MTVYELLYYCIDPGMLTVEIYSLEQGKELWVGPGDEIPEEYENAEVGSWDCPTVPWHFTINID